MDSALKPVKFGWVLCSQLLKMAALFESVQLTVGAMYTLAINLRTLANYFLLFLLYGRRKHINL